MTTEQFDIAYRAFARRRPFRPFMIEFASGAEFLVVHPEAVRHEAQVYVNRRPDGGYVVFAAESVCRLLDALAPAPQ
jgi:hypothetical protein